MSEMEKKTLDTDRLHQLLIVEQLKYCPDLPLEKISQVKHTDIIYQTGHIPPQYVFNNHHKRLKKDPYAHVFLYTKPFMVVLDGQTYFSHHINNQFEILGRANFELETWEMLKEICQIAAAKVDLKLQARCGFRWYEIIGDLIPECARAFLEAEAHKTGRQLFNWLVTSCLNEVRTIAQKESGHLKVLEFKEWE